MNEHDDELLHRYLDDALSAAEREAFEQRLADDPALGTEAAELLATRDAVSALLRGEVDALDLGGFADSVMAQVAAEPVPARPEAAPTPAATAGGAGTWGRFRGWWARYWTPVLVSAAAAGVVAWLVSRTALPPAGGPEGELDYEPVVVEAVNQEGTTTILISNTADGDGATVIWLLDQEEDDLHEASDTGEDPI